MTERGRNILPMIGFILIVIVVLGGFAFFSPKMNAGNFTVIDNSLNKSGLGYEIDDTREISTDGIDRITIRSVSSDIKVQTHNSNNVKAHFYGSALMKKESIPYLEVEKNGSEALVRIVYPSKINAGIKTDTKLDVVIPEGWKWDVEIKSISGDISADRLTGNDITLNTTSGKIEISEIEAGDMLLVSSVSGKCNIEKAQSYDAKINTTSGNIYFGFLEAEDIDLKTVSGKTRLSVIVERAKFVLTSGNIDAEFANGFDNISAKSISGNVNVGIPKKSEFDVNIETLSGRINCEDFLLSKSTFNKKELKGRVGSGDGKIDIHTASGDIKIYGLD